METPSRKIPGENIGPKRREAAKAVSLSCFPGCVLEVVSYQFRCMPAKKVSIILENFAILLFAENA
jgi:hypothetical protein